MTDRLKILQCIIENRGFAPSHSAFAKSLGYKGKMGIYRLMEGTVKEKTVDEIWDKVIDVYCMSDSMLYDLARIFEGAKYYFDKLLPEMNREHPEWIKGLMISLITDTYDYFSPEFQQKEVPYLKDMKVDEPDVFWGIVTMLYIRCRKIDVYTGDMKETFCLLIDALDSLLLDLFPEKADIHETSLNLKTLEVEPNLWKVILNCTILFKCYTSDDYIATVSQCGRLFHWGKRTFWRRPGESYAPGSEVWLLVEQDLARATNGHYWALRLEAEKEIETFRLKDVMLLFFWTLDKEDDPCVLQASRGVWVQREWCFYLYNYDGRKNLSFNPNPETGNLFELPEELQMIDVEFPVEKDEKVWARILNKWDENKGEAIFQKAAERLGGRMYLEDEYSLVDVLVSRTCLTLLFKEEDRIVKYELPIDAYGFLSRVTPSMDLLVSRHWDDNEVYVEWPFLGCSIKLSEFTRTE